MDLVTARRVTQRLTGESPLFLLQHDVPPMSAFSRQTYFICNLDKIPRGGGTHWTGLVTGPGYALYYDSYGLPASRRLDEFLMDLKDRRVIRLYNDSSGSTQSMSSVMCGWYVCHFLAFMARLPEWARMVEAGEHFHKYINYEWDPFPSLWNEAKIDRFYRNVMK